MECSEANVKKIKKCLSSIIDKEESILEYATVKLSICSPQTEKVFRSFIKEGILCVIINRNTSCLFLKLFELIEFNKVFEIELYTNIGDGYTVRDNYFHIIEFPGFFLGLSFPIIENPNVSNRSSLIQKAIISTSKFISINLSDYIYSHKFDYDKESSKKLPKIKTFNKIGNKGYDKSKNVIINDQFNENQSGNLELLSNKLKFNGNEDGQINVNENNSKNNNEFDSIKKFKSADIGGALGKKGMDSDSKSSNSNNSKSEEDKDNDSITVTTKNNALEKDNNINNNNNNNQEDLSNKNKDKNNIKGILKNNMPSNVSHEENMYYFYEKEKTQLEPREKNIFDSITIEDSSDKKVYKIVQFHILKDKMKLVKKLFKKNFYRFINPNKISFENIQYYKMNTYDFLNEEDFSSEEDEGQKTFVDYVPSNDMIGILENQDIQDERLLELMQQKKNLKEIKKKREDVPIKTTSVKNKNNF